MCLIIHSLVGSLHVQNYRKKTEEKIQNEFKCTRKICVFIFMLFFSLWFDFFFLLIFISSASAIFFFRSRRCWSIHTLHIHSAKVEIVILMAKYTLAYYRHSHCTFCSPFLFFCCGSSVNTLDCNDVCSFPFRIHTEDTQECQRDENKFLFVHCNFQVFFFLPFLRFVVANIYFVPAVALTEEGGEMHDVKCDKNKVERSRNWCDRFHSILRRQRK